MKKILCVCKGNNDRSPLMAAVLSMYLGNTGKSDVVVESAGILPIAGTGRSASVHSQKCARRIGIDLSGHKSRQIDQLVLTEYDLFVCATEEIAARLLELQVPTSKMFNAQVTNPWPNQAQMYHDATAGRIMAAMYEVMTHYFEAEGTPAHQ